MKFKIGDILKSRGNDLFNYKIQDIIIWKEQQIMEIQPLDLKEPKRNNSYQNFIVVNDKIKNIFSKVE